MADDQPATDIANSYIRYDEEYSEQYCVHHHLPYLTPFYASDFENTLIWPVANAFPRSVRSQIDRNMS